MGLLIVNDNSPFRRGTKTEKQIQEILQLIFSVIYRPTGQSKAHNTMNRALQHSEITSL